MTTWGYIHTRKYSSYENVHGNHNKPVNELRKMKIHITNDKTLETEGFTCLLQGSALQNLSFKSKRGKL